MTPNGKLTGIPPEDLIPDIEAAGFAIIIVRPKRQSESVNAVARVSLKPD